MNGLDHPARLQTRGTNSVKPLFSLLFSQEGESKDRRSQTPSQAGSCFPRAVLARLGYSELRCHDTALGLSRWWGSSARQTRPLCMTAACCKSYCCYLLLPLKVVYLCSYLWWTLLLYHSWNFISIYTVQILFLSLNQNPHHCDVGKDYTKMYRK